MSNSTSPDAACPLLRDPLQVAGREPYRFDRSFALLSRDVYEARGQGADGWLPVSDHALRELGISPHRMSDAKSGFQARLYAHETRGYVLAFRGTDEGRDWVTNGRQGFGLDARQYGQATTLADIVEKALDDQALVITGHSLGAGLESINAIHTLYELRRIIPRSIASGSTSIPRLWNPPIAALRLPTPPCPMRQARCSHASIGSRPITSLRTERVVRASLLRTGVPRPPQAPAMILRTCPMP